MTQHFKDDKLLTTGASGVIGPASSTDNAIARFNGTGGDKIQNSGVVIDDNNNIIGVATDITGTKNNKLTISVPNQTGTASGKGIAINGDNAAAAFGSENGGSISIKGGNGAGSYGVGGNITLTPGDTTGGATHSQVIIDGEWNAGGQTCVNLGSITTADINGGTIDGTTIATSDITVGAGKTLNVSAGTLTLADNQISGDKVEGGTINATTINTLTIGTDIYTTAWTTSAAVPVKSNASDTTPVYSTNKFYYMKLGKTVYYWFHFEGDGGAEGAGTAGVLKLALPVAASSNYVTWATLYGSNIGQYACVNGSTKYAGSINIQANLSTVWFFHDVNNAIYPATQNNTIRYFTGSGSYMVD